MHESVIISGRSNRLLAEAISSRLNVRIVRVVIDEYGSGETRVQLCESVQNKTVFLVQSAQCNGGPSLNDLLMENLLIVDACCRSFAHKIVLVLPSLPYSEEEVEEEEVLKYLDEEDALQLWHRDRMKGNRPSLTSPPFYKELCEHHEKFPQQKQEASSRVAFDPFKLVSRLISKSGASAVITMALPRPQLIGYFGIPVCEIPIGPVISSFLASEGIFGDDSAIVVSDLAMGRRGRGVATAMKCPLVLLHRLSNSEFVISRGSVEGANKRNLLLLEEDLNNIARIEGALAFLKRNRSESVTLLLLNFVSDVLEGDGLYEFVRKLTDSGHLIITTNSVMIPKESIMKVKVKVIDLSSVLSESMSDFLVCY
jgi:ribose-phosphate pyrophosphokinase